MLRVYHASRSEVPPHEVDANNRHNVKLGLYTNTHPDLLHMGDARTVKDDDFEVREHMHAYDIPEHMVYPATFGDEDSFMWDEHMKIINGADPTETKFGKAMSGVQEGLFESVPAKPDFAIKNKVALPYRNRIEGVGRISYMVPKSIINQEGVKYVGLMSRKEIK